ncbi:MAG: hypothetical protein JO345_21960 [Streptosporangiaceae bacterium]|nr:hypothetical protein [Streptosporangiaceae bacterium]
MALFKGNLPNRTRLRLLDLMPKGTLGAGNEKTQIGDGKDVPLVISVPAAQSVDSLQIQNPGAAPVNLFRVDQSGNVYGSGVSNTPLQQVAQVTLTSANILGMNTTPVSILPAPAAGQVLMIDAIFVQTKPGGTQYASGGAVTFQYHGTSTNPHTGNVTAAQINAATAKYVYLGPNTSGAIDLSAVAGLGLDITNGTGAFTTGNGTAVVTVYYTTITLS